MSVVGHQHVAGRAVEVAAADLAGWGGFATVLAGLLALAAGSGWGRALMLLCLGGLATAMLWTAAAVSRQGRPAPADPAVGESAGEPPTSA